MRYRSSVRAACVALVATSSIVGLVQRVGAETGRSGSGYWSVDASGEVFTVGDATNFGDLRDTRLNAPITGIAGAPGGQGYWLVAGDGGVFSFGSARFYGSAASLPLNGPVVGIAATRSGRGYWLAAADGGVFTYGDAQFYGSAGNLQLHSPVVGIAVTPTGRGYWLAAADGGVFTYGDAQFYGSAGTIRLASPVVGIAARTNGTGYWIVTRAGRVHGYGAAPTLGANDYEPFWPVGAIAASPFGEGFVVRFAVGDFIAAYGLASHCDGETFPRTLVPPVVGIAVAFDAGVVAGELGATRCGPLGGTSGPFLVSSPWHIDVRSTGRCAPFAAFSDDLGGAIPLRLDTSIIDRVGRLEMRATQMGGHAKFQLLPRGLNCLAVARPGTGGTQTLPFTTKSGGDTFPFTSASTITIAATGACTVDVYANSDGHKVARRTGSSFLMHVPAGTYFVSSSVPCTVKVS